MAKVAFKQAEVARAVRAMRQAGFENVIVDLKTGTVRSAPAGDTGETEAMRCERLMREAFGED